MWQDIVIAVVNIALGYAAVPQVVHNFKFKESGITKQTAFIASIGIYVITFVYLTLNLVFSTIVSGITATLWLTILIQGFLYNKKKKNHTQ